VYQYEVLYGATHFVVSTVTVTLSSVIINTLLALTVLLFNLIFSHAVKLSCLQAKSSVVAKPVKSAYKQFQLLTFIVELSHTAFILLLTILIPLPLVNAAGIVGRPVKSQYLPEVATVHNVSFLAYGNKSSATTVPKQEV
jgi:hypothetical protein